MNDFNLQTILFCDDDDNFRHRLVTSAKSHNLEAFQANSVDQAIRIYQNNKINALVVDLKMPDKSGLHLLQAIELKEARAVVLTGYGSIQSAIEAVRLGAHNYLTKPVAFKSIIAAIQADKCTLDLDPHIPSLEEVEKEYINRVLDHNQGNITKAAKDLGLHRRSLQRKLSNLT